MAGQITATFAPTGGMFSPGLPVPAMPEQPPRRFDFASGANMQYAPRTYEPFGFAALRAFSNVELVRLAIETRKDQIEALDWRVRPRKGASRPRASDSDSRVRGVERFLACPDGTTPLATWLRLLLEDLLALDAPAVERRRNRGGDLIGLDVIDGATIKVLIDETGRRPRPPSPAFQQIIKGRPWADLTSEDLIYCPRNPRPHHLYGFGPVEQIIVTINTAMRRQAAQLAWFSDGNTPAGLINAPEGWTPEQIKQFQEWFDARLAGLTAERAKILWGPANAKYQAFKDAPLKDEFDEWLARVVCFAFSLPPTPFIKQMNRSTAEEDASRGEDEGLAPLLRWAKRLFDGVIQEDLGHRDLEFSWELGEDLDAKTQAEVHDLYVRTGALVIDELREALGRDPLPGGLGSEARIYTKDGAVPLDMVRPNAEAALQASEADTTAPADPDKDPA